MGVLFLRGRQPVALREHELSLARTVANATAIALRNARILQSMRDQTQQITFARFEAEKRLKALQRYADFFHSAADGIVVIDADGPGPLLQPARPRHPGRSEEELARGARSASWSTPSDKGKLDGAARRLRPRRLPAHGRSRPSSARRRRADAERSACSA